MDIIPRNLDDLQNEIASLRRTIRKLQWHTDLHMYNNAGLMHAIGNLPTGLYCVVFADIDKMKAINTATGSHAVTNLYLRAGLSVREGEIAGQLYGDEIVFILKAGSNVNAFVKRIARQLRNQPLTAAEQQALIQAGVKPYLSATFAAATGIVPERIRATIAALSEEVLAQKAHRDAHQ